MMTFFSLVRNAGIQQENRHIRQLQHENKELRAALEEHQNAIELIMSKYRQHMSYLVNTTKLDKNLLNQQKSAVSRATRLFLRHSLGQGKFFVLWLLHEVCALRNGSRPSFTTCPHASY